ncbi:uncharacterized protein N7473_002141 [Penicillium subrubescens]|uniref:Uncharacterized protein n=1 Tax=Penicillium subrubescens TaxID=1316194 RepID=A0A1Q5SX84_9EURO|nr:uncharacterized protein N7473_002141 [Penicillium subrubescens]KAJ5905225.1 hypothetical protein N7473_002141 [Penicillium subrubescens]OKO92593.1 hypothetical protein PENSUB_12578 [Penicillium subrubescens]
MSISAKEQAKAQGQEDTREPDVDVRQNDSKFWSGIQPRYMSVDQEKRSQYDLEDVGKPEAVKGNRLLRSKPEGASRYQQPGGPGEERLPPGDA